jgi:predicted XRE-type DNA-binding protein
MSYSRACELLGFTTPKSLRENADLARAALKHFTIDAPLRMLVACDVLIKAAE